MAHDLGAPASESIVSLDNNLCDDCLQMVIDILSGSTACGQRWRAIETLHDTLTHLQFHLDGVVSSLLVSASKGCRLCHMISKRLFPHGDATPDAIYAIFVRPRDQNKYEFQACTGDVVRFVHPMEEWAQDPPKRLALFSRRVEDTEDTVSGEQSDGTTLHLGSAISSLPALPNESSDSERSFRQARAWLNDCRLHHTDCSVIQTRLPKRLVDIKYSQSTGVVYLYIPGKDEIKEYATISYSWGASGFKRLKTMIHPKIPKQDFTEAENCHGVSLNRFPQTLKDAIHVATRLGFRYVWIDSLCIVQDDKQDWSHQSAAMTDIYGGARLNISATSSENSETGMFQQSPEYGVRIGDVRTSSILQALIIGPPLEILDLEDKYASSRGWIFQERLVSVATLHYTRDGMIWECTRGTIVGHNQGFKGEDWKRQWKDVTDAKDELRHARNAIPQHQLNRLCQIWYQWIESYSERSLYNYSDRLNAIAGVAKAFSAGFGLSYGAGLWSQDGRNFVQGLLWRRFRRTPILQRFEGDTTPTWSWASVQGRLEYKNINFRKSRKGQNMRILDGPHVEEEVPGTFGRVHRASVKVRGLLQKIVVDRWIHPGVRQRGWQECGVRSGFVNPINVLITLDNPYITALRYYTCWCLRAGSFNLYDREADIFLLLEQDGNDPSCFRRVGLAETNPWEDLLREIFDSGLLESAKVCDLVLI